MTERELLSDLNLDVRFAIEIRAASPVTGRGWSMWDTVGTTPELRLFHLDDRQAAEDAAAHTRRYAPYLSVEVVPVAVHPAMSNEVDGDDEFGMPVFLRPADLCDGLWTPDGEPLLSCLDLAL